MGQGDSRLQGFAGKGSGEHGAGKEPCLLVCPPGKSCPFRCHLPKVDGEKSLRPVLAGEFHHGADCRKLPGGGGGGIGSTENRLSGEHHRRRAGQAIFRPPGGNSAPGPVKICTKEKPIWNTVLMYDLSRFSRSVPDSTGYKADLRDMGFKVISITESCTVDDPGGLQERMIDMMNEHESRKIGERVSSTFNSKASRARHCGGVPPLGYDVIEEKLVINESEAVIVKSIFEMYLAGFSYQKMADDLNSKGWLTKGGRPFTKNSFHDILRQKKYVGTFTWNRRQSKNRRGKGNNHAEKPLEEQVIVEGGCPQIIDDETFQMVQEKLAGRQNGTAESKSRRHYMLGGLKILKCKECGRHMVGHTGKSHGKEYITYRCPNKYAHKCTNKDISAERLEKYVSKILVNNYLNPKRIAIMYIFVSKYFPYICLVL